MGAAAKGLRSGPGTSARKACSHTQEAVRGRRASQDPRVSAGITEGCSAPREPVSREQGHPHPGLGRPLGSTAARHTSVNVTAAGHGGEQGWDPRVLPSPVRYPRGLWVGSPRTCRYWGRFPSGLHACVSRTLSLNHVGSKKPDKRQSRGPNCERTEACWPGGSAAAVQRLREAPRSSQTWYESGACCVPCGPQPPVLGLWGAPLSDTRPTRLHGDGRRKVVPGSSDSTSAFSPCSEANPHPEDGPVPSLGHRRTPANLQPWEWSWDPDTYHFLFKKPSILTPPGDSFSMLFKLWSCYHVRPAGGPAPRGGTHHPTDPQAASPVSPLGPWLCSQPEEGCQGQVFTSTCPVGSSRS